MIIPLRLAVGPFWAYTGLMRILIRGAAVIRRPEEGLVPKADVVIEGRRYAAVIEGGGAGGEFDRVVEGEGKLLIPGLVNAHTHLAMTLFRGLADDLPLMRWLEERIWPAERKLTPEDVYWFSLLGLAEMIRSGTTALADMYFFMEEVARAVEEAGLRALLSYGIIAPTPDRVEPELRKAERFAWEWDGKGEGRIRAALSPHAPYTCGPEVWKQTTALARELKIPIHTHLAETKEEVDRFVAEHGKSPVLWLEELGVFAVPVIAAHCVHVTEKDMEILAAHAATAVHCPSSNAKLACGIAPVAELLSAGVNVALGTDGAGSAGDLDMVEELRLAALLGKLKAENPEALPAPQALALATWRGAQALGQAREWGTIEEGRRADGVLVSLAAMHLQPGHNPLSDMVYAAHSSDVVGVFVDGIPLLLDGELLTIDEERVVAECRSRARRYR
ncbi:N-ethylammeline chlorohydrolase [Candidatus Acetothermia bacterium]|nr:MAG: N-ethylammeline chlorohydrolase [Candidatus Acetothermia bacterium]